MGLSVGGSCRDSSSEKEGAGPVGSRVGGCGGLASSDKGTKNLLEHFRKSYSQNYPGSLLSSTKATDRRNSRRWLSTCTRKVRSKILLQPLTFLPFLVLFLQRFIQPLFPWHRLPVGHGLVLLLGQLLPNGVDFPSQEPDASRPGTTGPHGAHHVQLLQQLLQLGLQGEVSPVLWQEDVIHCSKRNGNSEGKEQGFSEKGIPLLLFGTKAMPHYHRCYL